MSLTLIQNAEVFTPEAIGKQDVLIGGEKILSVAPKIQLETSVDVQQVDASRYYLCPGFVDSLTHITGGGGEGGFKTRTPEMQVSDAILGGVTTVTGALGTDAVMRTHLELLAKVKALNEEGLSAYFYTGNYHLPLKTLTGSAQQDIMLIDECIGIGEVAIADHRGSQPTSQMLAEVAAEARVGGMCANKAGVVMIHVGSHEDRLTALFEVADNTAIPLAQFYPTHINRNAGLLEEGIRFARAGGVIDFTASTTPGFIAQGEVPAARALKVCLENGIADTQVTFSTDGHASLPTFDDSGQLISLEAGSMSSLHDALTQCVLELQLPLSTALKAITRNPARVLKLTSKGQVTPGSDADLLLLAPDDLTIHAVMARGQWFKQENQLIRAGTFETISKERDY